jgi:lactate dehydrogenase-like 2-hydroxyacid dehydrogenase
LLGFQDLLRAGELFEQPMVCWGGLSFLRDHTESACKTVRPTSNSGQFKKVLIVGLGQLGFPVAKYVKEKGFDTYGYDINTEAMENAQRRTGIKESDYLQLIHALCLESSDTEFYNQSLEKQETGHNYQNTEMVLQPYQYSSF